MKKTLLGVILTVLSASFSQACEVSDYDLRALARTKTPISPGKARELAATSKEFCSVRAGANELVANLVREKLISREEMLESHKWVDKTLNARLGDGHDAKFIETLRPALFDKEDIKEARKLYLSRQEKWALIVLTGKIGDANIKVVMDRQSPEEQREFLEALQKRTDGIDKEKRSKKAP
ncbi:MAG: hypothetical protein AAB320_06820 [Elusimicrobiota bacterium]